ncbi:hypothetical protein [Bradyrhizobium zhanjiangense]|uniref:hypothetical protein n=1 Tax=Bradyrhizobium zhanjiangense TaxID=1325107 RepID=UPI001008E497|nr:hypothetical protein [Bradyrhizobium zhanjiangense]
MSVSLICSATNPIVSRALVWIARLGAMRTAGVSSVHARTVVIGPQTRQRAAAAFGLLNKIRSLAGMRGTLSGAGAVSSPQRSVVHPMTMDPQILIACQHVPPSRFGLFKFTLIQPPLSSIEPHGRS